MFLFWLALFSWSGFAQENNPVVMVTDGDGPLNSGCWATFYDEEEFRGSSMTIFNGYDVEDLEFSAGPLWREKVKSIVVGPSGRLDLYSRENYGGKRYTVYETSHLNELPWDDFQSFKLTCVSARGL